MTDALPPQDPARPAWISALDQVLRDLDTALDSQHDKARRIGRLGWTFPLWGPMHFVGMVPDSVSSQDLDAYFADKYSGLWSGQRRQVFRALANSESLDRWVPLVRQALTAFNRRQYLLTVPALLLVLEGSLAECAGEFHRLVRVPQAAKRIRETDSLSVSRIAWATVEGFAHSIFDPVPFSGPRPGLLNRHLVLNGRDLPDWTQLDCLRLLQGLHTVSVLRDTKEYALAAA